MPPGLVNLWKFARWKMSTNWPVPSAVPPSVYERFVNNGDARTFATALLFPSQGSGFVGSYTCPVPLNVSTSGTIFVGTFVTWLACFTNGFLPTMLIAYGLPPGVTVRFHVGTDGAPASARARVCALTFGW